jgi:enoyl-CoA hydratase
MLRHHHHNGITTLTLDRADKGNALSAALVEALIEQVSRTFADTHTRALVLNANGKHFCTGFDLSDLATSSEGDLLHRFVRVEQLLQLIWSAPVRTVALAQGRTWGAGADFFAACEVRRCAADTTFRFPGTRFGLALGTRRLAERVGADLARCWLLDGIEVNADDALKAALANGLRVVANGGDDASANAEVMAAVGNEVVDRETGSAIRALTQRNDADRDLAELLRSASRPGLKARIEHYVASLRKT